MKISTRLYFALALTAIMIAAIGAIYAVLEQRQRQSEDESDAGRILVGQIAALHSLAHEYAAIAQPRIERQWQLQLSSIRERFKTLNASSAARSLEISLDNADQAFAKLRQNHVERTLAHKRGAGTEETARFDAVEGAVESLMRLEIEKLLSSAELIAAEAHHRVKTLRTQAATGMMAVIVLFLTLVLAITLSAIRRSTRSIATLVDGVSAFAKGDLAHRIRVDGSDEMARLAKQFNAMAQTIERSLQREREHSAELQREIEERRNAEESLGRSEEQYRAFFELAAVGLAQADLPSGRLARVNDRYCEIFGYSRAEVLSMTIFDLTHPEDRERNVELARRLFGREEASLRFEKRIVRKDGTIAWVLVNATLPRHIAARPNQSVAVFLDITERKCLEEAQERSAQELMQAYRRLAHAQEAERRSLTKELHDSVGQNLSALHLHLQLMKRDLSPDSGTNPGGGLDDALGLLEEASERVRDLMANQRPPMLDQYGLFATLRWLAHETSQRSGIACALIGTEPAQRMPGDVESTLLRIAQEALMNAIKYSKADQIRIAIAVTANRARLEVADEGIGFDPTVRKGVDSKPTWGLLTMRERAVAFGGSLHIDTAPGAGTRVIAEIPIA